MDTSPCAGKVKIQTDDIVSKQPLLFITVHCVSFQGANAHRNDSDKVNALEMID